MSADQPEEWIGRGTSSTAGQELQAAQAESWVTGGRGVSTQAVLARCWGRFLTVGFQFYQQHSSLAKEAFFPLIQKSLALWSYQKGDQLVGDWCTVLELSFIYFQYWTGKKKKMFQSSSSCKTECCVCCATQQCDASNPRTGMDSTLQAILSAHETSHQCCHFTISTIQQHWSRLSPGLVLCCKYLHQIKIVRITKDLKFCLSCLLANEWQNERLICTCYAVISSCYFRTSLSSLFLAVAFGWLISCEGWTSHFLAVECIGLFYFFQPVSEWIHLWFGDAPSNLPPAHKMLEAQVGFCPVCVPTSFQLFPPTAVSNFLSHCLFIFPSVILTVVDSLIQWCHRAKKNIWSL